MDFLRYFRKRPSLPQQLQSELQAAILDWVLLRLSRNGSLARFRVSPCLCPALASLGSPPDPALVFSFVISLFPCHSRDLRCVARKAHKCGREVLGTARGVRESAMTDP